MTDRRPVYWQPGLSADAHAVKPRPLLKCRPMKITNGAEWEGLSARNLNAVDIGDVASSRSNKAGLGSLPLPSSCRLPYLGFVRMKSLCSTWI